MYNLQEHKTEIHNVTFLKLWTSALRTKLIYFLKFILVSPLSGYIPLLQFDTLIKVSSSSSIEDWLNLTCFRTFTALHWKREVSKEPFQFILERVSDDLSSTGVYQVLVYWQFLYKALKNGPSEELLFKNWWKIWNSIPDSDRVLPIVNINWRIPYRVGYWIFWYRRILMLACVLYWHI